MLGNILTFVLIVLILVFGFMFVKRWMDEGFEAAKMWAAGLVAAVVGFVADVKDWIGL